MISGFSFQISASKEEMISYCIQSLWRKKEIIYNFDMWFKCKGLWPEF